MKTGIRKTVARMLLVTMTSSVVPPVWAGTIDTESAITSDRARILIVLDRPDVQAALEAHGVSAAHAKARINALTDAEAAELAQQIDSAPAAAGGNPAVIFLLPIYLVAGAVYLVALLIGGVVSLASKGSSPSEDRERRYTARAEKRANKRSTQAAYQPLTESQ